jgi:hypothetical protein
MHVNPYSIQDPANLLEVGENSSHPELKDAKRIWSFRGYTFHSATEVEKYFKNEGLDIRRYWMKPVWIKEDWRAFIRIEIVEKTSTRVGI